jgi:crotonobetainyl-CoA:carnitine CoA-transferase CaiB-like acyl-CoA transferase
VEARERFMPLLRDLLATFTRAEISAICEQARLPFAPITRPEEMFDDPHLKSPGAMIEVTLPDGRTSPVPALPLEMKGRRFGRRLDIPRVGEHSASIAEGLGYGPDEIGRLAEAGILGLDRTADTPADTTAEPAEDTATAFRRHTG